VQQRARADCHANANPYAATTDGHTHADTHADPHTDAYASLAGDGGLQSRCSGGGLSAAERRS
jgi:hypothetical protein